MSWLVAVILILIVTLALQLGMVAYAMYVLLGLIFLSRFLTRHWSENVSAARETNRLEAEVGQQIAVVITVHNEGRWPIAWMLLEDLLPRSALIYTPPNLKITGRRVCLATLRPQSAKTIMYQVTCNRRGYYQLGPLVIETGDLFGLNRRYQVASKPDFLTVFPKIVPLQGYQIASRRPIGEVRMTHRLYEDPTRHAGVRHYQPGDPLSRVHWGATARTGRLHSKVYEPSSVAGTTVVLDFHQASYPSKNEPFRSELGVTAAASLAHAVYQIGQQVGLVTNGRDAADRIRHEGWSYDLRTRDTAQESASMLSHSERLEPQILPPGRGAQNFMRIRDTLARVELTDGLRFDELLAEAACRMPRDATVVAILQEVTEAYSIALGNLKRQGYAVTAVVSIYDTYDFADAAKFLLAEGVPIYQLRDEESISDIARAQFMGVGSSVTVSPFSL